MKLLFLGLLYNREEETDILSRSLAGVQNAIMKYQWNLIDGLDQMLKESVTIYSCLPVGTYPKYYKKLFLPTKAWSHNGVSKDIEVGCINLPFIKQLHRFVVMKRLVEKWYKMNRSEDTAIMVYSLYLPYLRLLYQLKKKYQKLLSCLIVTDLPNQYGFEASEPFIARYCKVFLERLIYRYAKAADSYVLVTEDMARPLDITEKPYVIVEGIAGCETYPITRNIAQSDTILLYSGTINERFGIDKLIKAFLGIPDDHIRLWICGVGDYEKQVREAADQDKRITYFGYLTSDAVRDLQKQATLLINPRTNEGFYTRYSFPSKTIDYMSTGRPVLCFKLDGIPQDYDNYLYYINDSSEEGIRSAILETVSKSREELDEFGKTARNYVLQNKNSRAQAEKIITLLQTPRYHVLQINITYQYGSTGMLVKMIHQGLINKGWKSSTCYTAYGNRQNGVYRFETTFLNYLRRGLNRYLGKKYIHSALGTQRLISIIKRLSPDLIHLHNIQQNTVDFPRLMRFLKKYGVPVVYTLHDCWSFTGGCYYIYHCSGYITGCSQCSLNKSERDLCNQSPKSICLEKSMLFHTLPKLQIISVSNWLKTCVSKSCLSDLPIEVIYNGIDTDIFKPSPSELRKALHIGEAEFVILGAANNWDSRKRPDQFIQLAELPGQPYRIILVGSLPDQMSDNIITISRTDDRNELARIYSCADVFFNSSMDETFGMTTVEAMSCGTPVIVYESTACFETVTESTGIVLHSDRIEELISAVETVKQKGKAYFSDSCRKQVRLSFSKDKMIDAYMKCYESMLKQDDIERIDTDAAKNEYK